MSNKDISEVRKEIQAESSKETLATRKWGNPLRTKKGTNIQRQKSYIHERGCKTT